MTVSQFRLRIVATSSRGFGAACRPPLGADHLRSILPRLPAIF
jgi:hypothetical protein